eukprot:12312506-Prorocentrum_lima.AAC.1
MTSSLVGSEMCIRDRWKEHGGKSHDCSVRQGGHIGGVPARQKKEVKSRNCLLYTSDAADDM